MLAVVLLAGLMCGSERRPVKTMTDPAAANVRLEPVRSSIAELAALQPPPSAHGQRRPAEQRVVTLDGYVVQVRDEDDGDLHVVIADQNGYTMIVEFPDAACMQGSRVLQQAASARMHLVRLLGSGPVRGDLKIRVTGVVFFDRYHRQSGVPSNAVELHPVLAVKALEGAISAKQPPPDAGQLVPREGGAPTEPSTSRPPPASCCKVCKRSQPCGDSCISLAYTCHKGPGCACSAR